MKFKRRFCVCLISGLALVAFLLLRSTVDEREASDYQGDALRRAVGVHFGRHHVPDTPPSIPSNARKSELDQSQQQKQSTPPRANMQLVEQTATIEAQKNMVTVATQPSPWKLFSSWVTSHQLYTAKSLQSDAMVHILHAMSTLKIERALVGYKGTQLKATFILAGQQKVVFKPMRYTRDTVITGDPYAGYDRHNAEIAAFHLDGYPTIIWSYSSNSSLLFSILGFRRAPPVAGRTVNLTREVIPLSEKKLRDTFFTQDGNNCFYGVCYYCKKSDPACAKGPIMEGSVTLWLPEHLKLKTWHHPWRRTYVQGRKARWEIDQKYCALVQQQPLFQKGRRLLDIFDTAVFDYLIGNADRHRYETFAKDGDNGMLLLLDNAKSFGNPNHDEWSILAPIYQCCKIRRSTRAKLLDLSKGSKSLGALIREATSVDLVAPILTDAHFDAVDRRLAKVLKLVNDCIDKRGEEAVLTNDYL